MIPADHIRFNDRDHTEAWVVGDEYFWAEMVLRDRPCDTCGDCPTPGVLSEHTGVAVHPQYGQIKVEGERRWPLHDLPGGTFYGGSSHHRCPACGGTGRHTFTIDVDLSHAEMGCTKSEVLEGGGIWPTRTYRVSVAPGMVLPILDECPDYDPPDHICQAWGDGRWIWHKSDDVAGLDGITEEPVTLPSAATPGMYAVKLVVHQ